MRGFKRSFGMGLAAVMLTAFGFVSAVPDAVAQSGFQNTVRAGLSGNVTRQVKLGLSKSLIVELPRAAQDVLVSDPETADAVVRSTRRAYVIGKKVGQTNIFFFDGNGQQTPPPATRLQPKRFHRVVVQDGRSFQTGGTTITLAAIAVVGLSGPVLAVL